MASTPVETDSQSNAASSGPQSNWIDPKTLMRIKNLELRAKVVVEGFFSGMHRSPFHGFSVEFSEYRQYSPGDDPRYIDWRLYARTDRHYIKRFEEETNLRCYLLVDRSRSMGYGPVDQTKSDYATTIAATLAYFLAKQRDAVGVMTFDDKVEQYVPARYRPGHLHRLMTTLESSLGGRSTDVTAPIDQIAQLARKRGLVVLISDLLAPIDALEKSLGYLRSHGHEVLVLRVLDRTELDLSIDEPLLMQDLESGRELYIDPEATRQQYRERFEEHARQIEESCQNLGIDLFQLVTDQPLELALYDFLQARLRVGRQVIRRSASAWGGAS